jgi:hypothetical protein
MIVLNSFQNRAFEYTPDEPFGTYNLHVAFSTPLKDKDVIGRGTAF